MMKVLTLEIIMQIEAAVRLRNVHTIIRKVENPTESTR